MKAKISNMNKSTDDNSHFDFVNSLQLIPWLFACQKLRNRKRNNCVVGQRSMSEIFGRSKTICTRKKLEFWVINLQWVGVWDCVVGVFRFWLGTSFMDEESRI